MHSATLYEYYTYVYNVYLYTLDIMCTCIYDIVIFGRFIYSAIYARGIRRGCFGTSYICTYMHIYIRYDRIGPLVCII